MDNFLKQGPALIKEAAKSPLGVFALMILLLSSIGYGFFHNSSDLTKVGIFVLMFLGVAIFGRACINEFKKTDISKTPTEISPKIPENYLTWLSENYT